MTLSKSVLASVIALATVAAASAQTKVYITGSTAFRGVTVSGISAILTGTVSTAYDGNSSGVTGINNANAVTWTGGSIGGTAVTIKASWSGSAAGIQTVAGAPTFSVKFLPDGATGGTNDDPRKATDPSKFESAVPDVAMSDVFQGTSPFHGTFNGVTYANLTDNQVGVVSFVWAASKNFPLGTGSSPISSYSMTPQIAQQLFVGGNEPLSLVTGLTADENTALVATGRDFDSGTRLTAVTESGIGANTLLKQYQPTISGGAVTALALYPRTTINGVDTQQDGNSGESSGSSLRAFLTNTVNASAIQNAIDPTYNGGYLVTYLGVGDFNNVSGSGAVQLLYAGNTFSQTAIEEGRYTFWGYEHLDYKSTLAGVKLSFATNLRNHIQGETTATLNPNVSLSDMQVSRTGDGGIVSSNLH